MTTRLYGFRLLKLYGRYITNVFFFISEEYSPVFMMCLASEPVKHWFVSGSQPVSCAALAFSRILSYINVNSGCR